jgi:Putative metallopeptidase
MQIGVLVGSLLIALVGSWPALAQRKFQAERIHIAYVKPENPAHDPIYTKLRDLRVLETLQDLLGAIRLPKTLRLQLSGCKGVANAWYEGSVVNVCYEYIEEIRAAAPQTVSPEGIAREDAIAGPVAEAFLHETGHALFHLLDLPIFGREEDAADQFAAFVMLQLPQEDARKLLGGVAFMLRREVETRKVDSDAFSDVRGLPAQRFFNLVCMAYGSDPKYFADMVEKGYLPKGRAEDCQGEYEQVAYAVQQLIAPHVDAKSRLKMKSTLKRMRAPSRLR